MIKVVVCLASCLFFAQFALASPTVYGLVTKELRNVSHEKAANGSNTMSGDTGSTDVDGWESRLGAKGSHDIDGHMVDYRLELGTNSSRDNGAGARIRVRLAYFQFNQDWGSVLLGQAWQVDHGIQARIDPLSSTGAQQIGLEGSGMDGFVAGYLGYRSGYFDDMLRISTKSFNGIKYHFTYDKNNNTTPNGAVAPNYMTHTVTYNKDAIEAYLLMRGIARKTATATAVAGAFNEEKRTGLGVRYAKGPISVGLSMNMSENGEVTTSTGAKEALKFTSTLFGFGYTMGKSTYGLSYGNTDFGEQVDTAVANVTDAQGKQTQTALGWKHQCSKEVSMRAWLAQYSRSLPSKSTVKFANGKETTSAMVIGLGASVSF